MLVAALVDGFNLYYNMNKKKYSKYKWLNFDRMFRKYLNKDDIPEIHYFTTINYNDIVAYRYNKKKYSGKRERHMTLIKAEESKGVFVHYGYFRDTEFICRKCNHTNIIRKEKQTDVSMGAYLAYLAFSRNFDKFIILTADTDLISAVKLVKENAREKKIDLLLPPGVKKSEISKYCDKTFTLDEEVLKDSLFPLIIETKNNEKIVCPEEWRMFKD